MSIDVWADAPEGATHYDPVDQNFLREVGPALLMYRNNVGWVVPHHCQYATTVEETERPLMIRPVWNGEGLPPVGTVCEHKRVHEWQEVEVFAVKLNYNGSQTALFTYENGCWAGCAESSLFRPVRTAEQIAADEREQACRQICLDAGSPEQTRGQMETAYRLYDAGYRKQVAQ